MSLLLGTRVTGTYISESVAAVPVLLLHLLIYIMAVLQQRQQFLALFSM